MHLAQLFSILVVASVAAGRTAPLYTARAGDKIEDSYFIILEFQHRQNIFVRVETEKNFLNSNEVQIECDESVDNADVEQSIVDVQTYLAARFIPTGVIKKRFNLLFKGFSGIFSDISIQTIRRLPFVKYVEEDQVMRTTFVDSWGLDRIDDRDLYECDGNYSPHNDGNGVAVFVIDTGVLITHEDFGGRAFHGWDAIDDDFDTTDCNGHGTHCSGTVAGTKFGVAKGAFIVGVRVLGCLGFGSNTDVVGGMEWVASVQFEGLKSVVSMSLGGGASLTTDAAVAGLYESGVFVSVSAGNEATDACNQSPARAEKAMAVGATDNGDYIASFSNYGSCVGIFAPGVGITSAWYTGDDATNTISGTSMACPHVSGAAALILHDREYSKNLPDRVWSTLLNDATPGCVNGLVDGASMNKFLYVH